MSGRSVYFSMLVEVIDLLRQAQVNGTFKRRMALLLRPALLIVDALSDDGGRLFFQLVNARHERGSMILTTIKGFVEWGGVVGDEVMAAAMLDRLLHRFHVVNIQGASYRMREYKAAHGKAEMTVGETAVATLPPSPLSEN